MTAAAATPSRRLAHEVLVRVARDAAYASRALGAALDRALLPARDGALATDLVYGTLRHLGPIDAALAAHLHQPAEALPPPVRAALRLGGYQLLFTRVPAHSAVHESVALARPFGKLAGLVNAVLRRIAAAAPARSAATPTYAVAATPTDGAAATPANAAAVGSTAAVPAAGSTYVPAWARAEVARRRDEAAAAAWDAAHAIQPAVTLRPRPGRQAELGAALAAAGIAASAVRLPGIEALSLRRGGPVRLLPGYAEGAFVVQDPAANLAGAIARVTPGMTVLDVCAAPGGKALHLADRLGDAGRVVALDVHPGRIGLVAREATRLGLTSVRPGIADGRDPAALREALVALADGRTDADLVVVDAPCSGLGTLRRHPERRPPGPDALAALVALQADLLDSAITCVRPGGGLLYAVCTVTAAEGPEQVTRVLARHPDFVLDPLDEASFGPLVDGGCLATWTDRDGCDSFFAARLRRR